jgi:hypothetical protein
LLLTDQQRRPARDGEWNRGKAIAFIVTLAATGTVTLAAREAGMSRKAAYALKRRDPLFAASWDAAKKAAGRQAKARSEGNSGGPAAPSTSSSREPARSPDPASVAWRNSLIAQLQLARESARARSLAALARRATLP